MRISVVVPFSRPENWGRVRENFERQEHADKLLVIVANGAAVDRLPREDAQHPVITSEASPAHARNAGLAWARNSGAGVVSFFDDDDYYGPGYLTEVAECLSGHPDRVATKAIRYARWPDGLYYYLSEQPEPTFGCALSGYAERLPDFPLTRLEDAVYKPELDRAGLSVHTLGPRFFVYDRTAPGRSECAATQLQFLRAFGPALHLGQSPNSLANSDAAPSGPLVPVPTWDALLNELAERASGSPPPITTGISA